MTPIYVYLRDIDRHISRRKKPKRVKCGCRQILRRREGITKQEFGQGHAIAVMSHLNTLTGCRRRGSQTNRMKKTSQVVIRTPAHSGGFGKSTTGPMAEPRNSARSVLIIAVSARTWRRYGTSQRYSSVFWAIIKQ